MPLGILSGIKGQHPRPLRKRIHMTKQQEIEFTQKIAESLALTAKLQAETAKLQREYNWYPVVIMTAAVAATATIVKLLFI